MTRAALALFASFGSAVVGSAQPRPAGVAGLDHVPIAVADLEKAAERYRALGFTLKPGRPHDNGIRNQHAKFADKTELELITAPEARDGLTTTYRRYLAQGDGPAFLALFAPSLDAAAERLGIARPTGPTLDVGERDGLGYLFLGRRNASPTDRPEHLVHANTATALIAVWLAGDLAAERALFETLGARIVPMEVRVPDRAMAAVARFAEGDVTLLPADRQRVPGRRIVGATVRVRSIAAVEAALKRGGVPVPPRVTNGDATSVFVPPDEAQGLWLEFRQEPEA